MNEFNVLFMEQKKCKFVEYGIVIMWSVEHKVGLQVGTCMLCLQHVQMYLRVWREGFNIECSYLA